MFLIFLGAIQRTSENKATDGARKGVNSPCSFPRSRARLVLLFLAPHKPRALNRLPCSAAYYVSPLLQVFFFCLKQAAEGCGGETPLVKNKELLSKLDSAVVRKFEEKKLRYVRYLPDKSRGEYMNWQHVFFTENKEVQETCEFDWKWSIN